jgi:crotonobetainyl-CoA:carnitine CoA-transferase CaiB-like acyl-CoA transferase
MTVTEDMRGDEVRPAPQGAGPLAGVRVVDLTSVIMGPFGTHILADLGADVVKVESPQGDSFRAYRPMRHAGMSGGFLHLNRNKRSLLLDLKRPEARAALDKVIAGADVFVHSMRPDAIARLGYPYEAVRNIRPDIVYCGAHGFSEAGRYAGKAAYDDIIQAATGLSALQAAMHGVPGYVPTVLCDKVAGQAIAYSIMAALFQRARGGGGQAIEVPMFETLVEFNLVEHMMGAAFDPPLGPPVFNRVICRKPYATKDGYACILPYSDRNWRDFFDFTGRLEFNDDPRFASLGVRVEFIDVLYAAVAEEALKRTTAQWVAFCDRVSIPCMPVQTIEEVMADPHLADIGFFGVAEHPSEGPYRTMNRPITFGGSAFAIRTHAPWIGEHSAQILAEAGLCEQEIEAVLTPQKSKSAMERTA